MIWGDKSKGIRKTATEFMKDAQEGRKPAHEKPKILLIDLDDDCYNNLNDAGYNVQSGTFGIPIKVDRSGKYYCVPTGTASLPNLYEQEIIIANVIAPSSESAALKPPGTGAYCMWQKASFGSIDPRPIMMDQAQGKVRKILRQGGLLVLLMAQQITFKYIWSAVDRYAELASYEDDHTYSNWGIFSALGNLRTAARSGDEVSIIQNELTEPLKKGNLTYSCIFEAQGYHDEAFVPLAENKYGESVAALFIVEEMPILLLPQIENIHDLILELVESTCYQLRPNLFPHLSGANWLHDERYEIPEIVELNTRIETLQNETEAKILKVREGIEKTREEQSYWYTLLNGTGRDLVLAVITVLKDIGFEKIIDVDEEISTDTQEDDDNELMEDIRVEDKSPWLIIDVKGVNGHPEDDESFQAEKHAMMRMKEWDRTDLKPLTIINHQRQLLPHDRDQLAYRKKIIGNAERTGLGLLTSWDLYNLMRNMRSLGWSKEAVSPIFYRSGRIDTIPEHYSRLGNVVEVWESAFGVVPEEEIRVGDRLAYRIHGRFTEFETSSLQIDGDDVAKADVGSNCGIAFEYAKNVIKKKMTIYKVATPIEGEG